MNLKHIIISLMALSLFACKEDPEPWQSRGNNGWEYYNGDGEIKNNHNVIVDFDIDNNLNVDGTATINTNLTIGNDLNLNRGGKIIIDTYYNFDTVYIDDNMNINDSLLIFRGVVIVDGNLNVNNKGVINVADNSQLIVRRDINNSGHVYGMRNVFVDGKIHLNGNNISLQSPLDLR